MHPRPPPFSFLLIACTVFLSACTSQARGPKGDADDRFTTWTRYEGEPGATSFSTLQQINRSNVHLLEVAWIYDARGATDANPVVVDSFMYVFGEDDAAIALHAGTGRELWAHVGSVPGRVRQQAVVYWESPDRSDRRVFFQKGRFHTIALDARTGEPIASFGDGGVLDLRPGLGIDPELVAGITVQSPGVIYDDLMILGSGVGEGYFAPPGHIRAFDVRTGEQAWIFHTLPQPGEYGYDTWPPGRTDNENVGNSEHASGGANAWGGMSVDVERGIVYVPLGAVNYDFYGVDRPGKNLFGNSLVALNARTGGLIWYFQTVHHDLWDYDLAATPVLMTVQREGRSLDVVALATKQGVVYVFNRETGEPLWPIEDRPVPPSEMPGEQAWPTQPFPTKPEPFVPLEFDVETDVNPYLHPADRDSLVDMVRGMLYEGPFTPPSTRKTLQVPGNQGGANWGSTAGNPFDGTFYVVALNLPSVLELIEITAGRTGTGGSPIDRGQSIYQMHCQICHGADLGGQPMGGIPSLVGVLERLSDEEYEGVVRSGVGTMPPFPQLDTDEFHNLRLYVRNPELALVAEGSGPAGDEAVSLPSPENVRYQSGWNYVVDRDGLPVIRPPWFRLTAYDLNEGTIKWQVPVGHVPHLETQGITGTGAAARVRGGPAVTAGGLVFQPAGDRLLALDSEDGSILWTGSLPASSDGIPSVYQVDGRQYVVAASPSPFGRPRAEGTAYVAFSLPEGTAP